MAAVALVALIRDGDRLDASDAARREQPVAGGEERAVLLVADRLEYLDRGDLRETPLRLAVVLVADLDEALEPGLGDPPTGELVLLARDRQGGDSGATLGGRVKREAAPPAADLEQVVLGLELELVADAAVLVLLRLLERLLWPLEVGAGVGQRLVEEEAVEIVADVVVVVDVSLGPAETAVGREVGPEALERRNRGEWWARTGGLDVEDEEREEGDEVVRVPVTGGVGLAEAEPRAPCKPAEEVGALDGDGCGRTRTGDTETVAVAVRELELEFPDRDLRERPERDPLRDSCEPVAAGGGKRPESGAHRITARVASLRIWHDIALLSTRYARIARVLRR